MDQDEREDKVAVVLRIINSAFVIWLVVMGGASVYSAYVHGGKWMYSHICEVYFQPVSTLSLVMVIPISIVLLIFRATRGYGGVGLILHANLLAFSMWAHCLAQVSYSKMWMTIGLLSGGIGVIPVAFVDHLIHSEFVHCGSLLLVIVVVVACWIVGHLCSQPISSNEHNQTGGISIAETKAEFHTGLAMAELTSTRHGVTRGAYHGSLLAFVLFGPLTWWIRLPIVLVVLFVVGVIATSTKAGRYL